MELTPIQSDVPAENPNEAPSPAPSLTAIVEAMLFCTPKPLAASKLAEMLDEAEIRDVRNAVNDLNIQYAANGRSFRIQEVGGGYQYRTIAGFQPYIQKLEAIKPIRLTLPTIETLAIVAYQQPITRARVEFIRGVDSSYTLRTLMHKKLIKMVGREAVPGRPILYGTTRQFLEVFGLKDIQSLPPLSELGMEKTDAESGPTQDSPQESPQPDQGTSSMKVTTGTSSKEVPTGTQSLFPGIPPEAKHKEETAVQLDLLSQIMDQLEK